MDILERIQTLFQHPFLNASISSHIVGMTVHQDNVECLIRIVVGPFPSFAGGLDKFLNLLFVALIELGRCVETVFRYIVANIAEIQGLILWIFCPAMINW